MEFIGGPLKVWGVMSTMRVSLMNQLPDFYSITPFLIIECDAGRKKANSHGLFLSGARNYA
jgi:hypothetical protein